MFSNLQKLDGGSDGDTYGRQHGSELLSMLPIGQGFMDRSMCTAFCDEWLRIDPDTALRWLLKTDGCTSRFLPVVRFQCQCLQHGLRRTSIAQSLAHIELAPSPLQQPD